MSEQQSSNDDRQIAPARPGLLRAVIAAGNPVICEGLRSLLSSSQVEVAGLARSGPEACQQVEALAPDLVFLEAQVLASDEAATFEALKTAAPEVSIIVLSLYEEPIGVARAVALGASAYLCGDISQQSLLLAVDAALQKHVLLDRAAFAGLSEALSTRNPPDCKQLVPSMTPREWEVLELIARGLSYCEMAAHLAVTAATVRAHACHILRKLQVPDRARAASWAAQHGLGRAGANAARPTPQ